MAPTRLLRTPSTRRWWGSWLFLLSLTALLAGCRSERRPAPDDEAVPGAWLTDITQEAGIDFVHDAGAVPGERYFMPQIVGSGAALFDYDGDGRLDIYLIHNGGPQGKKNQLFHQEKDGRFTNASAGSGLDVAGHGMGAAVGDFDNDGRPDLVVTEYGRTRLFRNQGDGRFTDISAAAGIDNPLWGTSAAFLDYDRDGWLDLVVVNYVAYDPSVFCDRPGGQREYCAPSAYGGTITRLFHNRGAEAAKGAKKKTFEDVTVASGLGAASGPGLGVCCADFTGDGWPDLLIANDGKPNHLWVNQHDGTFKEEALARGIGVNTMGKAEANMGIAVGDICNMGRLDVFVTHLSDENPTLWRQGPGGHYVDRTAAAGLTVPRWRGTGFGTALVDLDQDGALDLVIVNGRIQHGPSAENTDPDQDPFWKAYAQRNQLFAGDGKAWFRDISEQNPALSGQAAIGRGLALGDIDNDGAIDLLITSIAGRARLLRNSAAERGHGLLVRALLPRQGGRDALGAELRLFYGGQQHLRWINPGYSYLCSNDPRAHFGLGAADHFDRLEVTWPDGTQEHFPGGPADRVLTLRQGEGTSRAGTAARAEK